MLWSLFLGGGLALVVWACNFVQARAMLDVGLLRLQEVTGTADGRNPG